MENKKIHSLEDLNNWLSQVCYYSDDYAYNLKVITKDSWYFLFDNKKDLLEASKDIHRIMKLAHEMAFDYMSNLIRSEEGKEKYKEHFQEVGFWDCYLESGSSEGCFRKDIVLNSVDSINQWLKEAGLGNCLKVFKKDKYWILGESVWQTEFRRLDHGEQLLYFMEYIADLLNLNIDEYKIQEAYLWEIRNIEDANEWIENIEMDSMFHFNEIKNSKGNVYQVIDDGHYVTSSRDLDSLMYNVSDLITEFETDNACDRAYGTNISNEELENEIERITDRFTHYKVITEKQAYLKSNRLIKDLESANQWIADLGYEGAIRFNYDGGKLWTVELLIDNEWKQYERVESCQKALEYVCGLILPKADMPEIAVGIDKNKVALIDSLETANQWLQSLEKGENYKFVYRKNPFYKENYFLLDDRKLEIIWAITLKDCIINSCGSPLWTEIPNISDKLEVAPEKELRVIRSIRDANDWLRSIGKDTDYKFQYAKGVSDMSTGKIDKGTVIQCIELRDNFILYSSKHIKKVVDSAHGQIRGAKPLCKNTIFDLTTLNMWLDTIDYKYHERRPYVFKKKTENGNVYSVWDIYKNGDKIETKLEFVNTSIQISLYYILNSRNYIKRYLWDVQLKKGNMKTGGNIIINNLETANKWIASLGYKDHIRFNCEARVQNTDKGKIRYPAYYLQERLSGDNWKKVNNTYGKFNDILNLFCKLANITEIPKCTIVFSPQVEEQGVYEIQSVKGANIWFDKINIQGCKFRIKSREDKQNKRLYTIEFMNLQGQIGKFYECASLKESILYFCKCYQIKAPAVANI